MIVRQGRFGRFAACPNYPECKNTKAIDKDGKEIVKEDTAEKTDLVCEKCGKEVLKRKGRFGEFYACSDYPRCKYTKQIIKPLGVPCPKCGGEIAIRSAKNRSVYYSCENYPTCDFSSWDKPTNEKCPNCDKLLFVKKLKDSKSLICADAECGYKRALSEDDEY